MFFRLCEDLSRKFTYVSIPPIIAKAVNNLKCGPIQIVKTCVIKILKYVLIINLINYSCKSLCDLSFNPLYLIQVSDF